MDYPLENLGHERFQQLCQALLTREFPQTQCFPVGQPDGGRDAVSYHSDPQSGTFTVFQVKYLHKPLAEDKPHNWLIATMEDEAPKVRDLIPKGASRYYLITNIPGTARLESGAIDRLNEELSRSLGIPSICWWRDDINRRLDDSWSLKWVYPELMAGPDFLRLIIESGLSEHTARRSAAVKAFIRHQYELDEHVRFKQVELQNRLLDLFIDVPVAFQREEGNKMYFFHATGHGPHYLSEIDDPDWDLDEPVGAASLLLDPSVQERIPRVVVEGAPGQGKSTIAQYICQVHRMRLLRETAALSAIPSQHKDAPVRLPIKVDLRDFATWLAKKNPFGADDNEDISFTWQKSLESFLAALISHQSGGANFSYDDLLAVGRISSILLVFDGLDEVADISRRSEVVQEIVTGVRRLEENVASLQTIITSRPAAFANSPGMPRKKYIYLQLLSLSRPLIDQYAERWIRARRLDSKGAGEFKRVLKTKMDQPHLKDLARNPMQLAILLSLIHTRGSSLPDKRTALYDSYVDLFFSRESEKSPAVREHRELLVDIHGYLAWVLHSQAERNEGKGSIAEERLRQLVSDYLSKEGHDPSVTNTLFRNMVERVVALVSRVEGTFEFEVQPLREYFAARFLYNTAPYSPPGNERVGTKPDRFDAIASNFYWLNVTRFFAGCFSKGELPTLVDRLQELANREGFRRISHPKVLAVTLLSDWVFTQHPRSVQQVVKLIFSGTGLRGLISSWPPIRRRFAPVGMFVLPAKCGGEEFIETCFDILNCAPVREFALEIVDLLKANIGPGNDVADMWLKYFNREDPSGKRRWLEYAVHLGILSTVELGGLRNLIAAITERPDAELIAQLLRARRADYLQSSQAVFDDTVDAILSQSVTLQLQRRVESSLDALAQSVDPARYACAYRDRRPLPLSKVLEERMRRPRLTWENRSAAVESYESYGKINNFLSVVQNQSAKRSVEWAAEIEPWDRLVEAGREIWGERLAFFHLANVAAGIRSATETCKDFSNLLDHSSSLCRRARYARLRSGSVSWWKRQFESASSENDRALTSLVALTWASTATLVENADVLDVTLRALHKEDWCRLFNFARRAISLASSREEKDGSFDVNQLPSTLSVRAVCALGMRAQHGVARSLYNNFRSCFTEEDPIALEFMMREALDLRRLGTEAWQPDLAQIRRCYQLGAVGEPHLIYGSNREVEPVSMPIDVAIAISEQATHYPAYLVGLAEERCRLEVSSRVEPVTDVALRERWFT